MNYIIRSKVLLLWMLPVVFFLMVLGGCRTHKGEIGWVDSEPTMDKQYETVRTVTGEASAKIILGIFGRSKLNLYDQARRDLLEKADLDEDQRIINRTLDEVVAGFPPSVEVGFLSGLLAMIRFYYKKTVYLSGEVVEVKETD